MMYFYEQKQKFDELDAQGIKGIHDKSMLCYNTLLSLIRGVGSTSFEYMNDEDREFLEKCLNVVVDDVVDETYTF